MIGKRDRNNLLTSISDVNGVALLLASHSYILYMFYLSNAYSSFYIFTPDEYGEVISTKLNKLGKLKVYLP